MNAYSRYRVWPVIVFALLILLQPGRLTAKPVTCAEVASAVEGWLRLDPNPLGAVLGQQVEHIEAFADNGETIYYVVYLSPCGLVVVSANDEVEPIIAFSSKGVYNLSPENHLALLVSRDLPMRIAAIRTLHKVGPGKGSAYSVSERTALEKMAVGSRAKWDCLRAGVNSTAGPGASGLSRATTADGAASLSVSSVSDPRVDPLLSSRWGQRSVCDDYCYNYYTPNHYPCGCVATAIAQVMRYHQHPVAGIGVRGFTIWVNGNEQTAYTLGGNGSGGPYLWSQMDLTPDCGTSSTQYQAIGALCFDAGISVHMSYYNDGSGANMGYVNDALTDTFDYGNAVYAYNGDGISTARLENIINTNLDAEYPVILGLRSPTVVGHAIVADGYGYNTSTPYHHLNMGWDGADDAWYNLPDVIHWDTVVACIYNTYVSGSGEIISGRVTDVQDAPIGGVMVIAETSTGQTFTDTTDSRGIYALPRVPSSTAFTISAAKGCYHFSNAAVSTGRSNDGADLSGNVWSVDFHGGTPDFSANGTVGAEDLAVLTADWLETAAYVPVGTEPDSSGLVIHYKFNETGGSTASDSSGNNNHGQVRFISNNAPAGSAWDPAGYDANGCIDFDGSVKVVVPVAAFSGLNSAVTVSLWVNGDPAVQPDQSWGMPFHGGNPTNDRLLHTHIPTKDGDVMFESGSYNAQRLFWEGAGPADWEGQWNHYAFTLDTNQANVRIYHNGQKKAEGAASLGVGGITSFHVGCGIFAGGIVYEYFGKIDDFRVYDYALSADEVLYIANDGATLVFDSPANLYDDDIIDFKDFAEFALYWLETCQ